MLRETAPPRRTLPRRQVLTLGLAFAGLTLAALRARAQVAAIGQVAQQAGSAIAQRGGDSRALFVGAPVLAGERIVTASDATLLIAFADGSRLTLGPDSVLVLTGLRRGAGGALGGWIDLASGIVRLLLRPGERPDGFDVRTRAAVASVRATEWIVEARGSETDVFVLEGQVAVAGTTGAAVLLNPGEGVTVREGAAPPPPSVWGAPRVQGVIARTRLP